MRARTAQERRIWDSVYAAAFVADARARATLHNTTPATVAEDEVFRSTAGEAAQGLADSAVLAFRETAWARAPKRRKP